MPADPLNGFNDYGAGIGMRIPRDQSFFSRKVTAVSTASRRPGPATIPWQQAPDDLLTVAAIACLAFLLTDTLQQALGHALPALLTVSPFGVLTAAGWSSAYDNRFIDTGGCLVNFLVAPLAAAAIVACRNAAPRARLLLLLVCAFNLLAGSGYLIFAGATDFGDWYSTLQRLAPQNVLRILLLLGGALLWFASLFVAGSLFGRQFGISRLERTRAAHLTFCAWLAVPLLGGITAAVNRIGLKFVLLSDFPATTLAQTGLLFIPLCFHGRPADDAAATSSIRRSWIWIAVSAALTAAFVLVLGRGLTLQGKVQ